MMNDPIKVLESDPVPKNDSQSLQLSSSESIDTNVSKTCAATNINGILSNRCISWGLVFYRFLFAGTHFPRRSDPER